MRPLRYSAMMFAREALFPIASKPKSGVIALRVWRIMISSITNCVKLKVTPISNIPMPKIRSGQAKEGISVVKVFSCPA